MNPQEIVFDMVAVTKVEVNGVEYVPGAPFKAVGVQQMRFLLKTKSARSASEVTSVTEGGKGSAQDVEIDFTGKADNQGTQHDSARKTVSKTRATRAKDSGKRG